MKQKRKWFLASATNDAHLSEINFKEELLGPDGEPKSDIVEFYDGRLIPQPSPGETYLKRENELVRMLVTEVSNGEVEYSEHQYPSIKRQPIQQFLEKFKLEKL
jgi:hypothetical protein